MSPTPSEEGQECSRCTIIRDLQRSRGVDKLELHRNKEDLMGGASLRCWWCLQLLRRVEAAVARDGDQLDISTISTTASLSSSSKINVIVTLPSKELHVTFGLFPGNHNPFPALEDNTASEHTWGYVMGRLTNCELHHEICKPAGKHWMPTRLMQIQQAAGPALWACRIIETAEHAVDDGYVTLSHHWGSSNNTLQLTAETSSQLRHEVPAERMPRKYTDAIIVALRLGIRYIWIDALVGSAVRLLAP
jgi:hypothetical protein